jgi:hypothetical protein
MNDIKKTAAAQNAVNGAAHDSAANGRQPPYSPENPPEWWPKDVPFPRAKKWDDRDGYMILP